MHNLIGKIYTNINQIDKAVAEFKTAEILLLNPDNKSSLLTSYMSLGNIYIQRDMLPEAMDNYNNAILDPSRLSNLYNNLVILNLYLKNNEKALELYSKALLLFEKNHDTLNIAGTTTNIGSIYMNLENYEIAKSYCSQGYELFKSIKMKEGEAHALLKLGLLEIRRYRFEDAVDYLNQSIQKQVDVETTYSGNKSIFIAETLINRAFHTCNSLNLT